MKVVLVQNQFPDDTHWGGISTFGWFMTKALEKEGAQVYVIAQSATESIEEPRKISDAISIHRIPGKKPISGKIKQVLGSILPDKQRWFSYNAWHYLKQLENRGLNYDIVDCADYLGCAYYFLKDAELKKPVVVTCHTPAFLADELNEIHPKTTHEEHRKIYAMEMESIRLAHGLLSPSHRLSQVLAAKTGRQLSDFFTNPYPYPVQQEIQLDQEEVGVKRPYILFVGRIERRKGVATLLKAWNESKWKHDFTLVLAGKKTNHQPIFDNIISELAIESIQFIGPQNREQLAWLYRNANLTILPSEPFDNYPYSCIESMAYAAPTLVSDSGGMSEMIHHEENGWIFRTGSVVDLKDKIDLILDLPIHDRIAIGLKGQNSIRRINATSRIAQRTLNYYTRLCNEFK